MQSAATALGLHRVFQKSSPLKLFGISSLTYIQYIAYIQFIE